MDKQKGCCVERERQTVHLVVDVKDDEGDHSNFVCARRNPLQKSM